MKKPLITGLLAALLLLGVLAPAAYASEISTARSGSCGDGITWSLEDYTLTISGSGEMEDGCPWENWMTKVEHVVLSGGVTKIGEGAFDGFTCLETVDFGDALVEIGAKAFRGCNDLSVIHLPETFRTFGAECFRDCTDLLYVYCDGPMPRFSDSCLWTGNYIAVFYPTNNPWPAEAVNALVHNFGGRLGIMMGSYDPDTVAALEGEEAARETEETVPAETEAEETVPETTEAIAVAAVEETQAPTVPETEAPTVPETTQAPTVPETTVPETTAVPTTEAATIPTTEATEDTFQLTEATEETVPAEVEKKSGSAWIGLVMIAGVLTFLIAGAMIFRSTKRGRY